MLEMTIYVVFLLVFVALGTGFILGTARRILGVQVGLIRSFFMGVLVTLLVALIIPPLMTAPPHLWNSPEDFAKFAITSVLVGLWGFVIAAAGLVALEVVLPTGSLGPPRLWLVGLNKRRQVALRSSQLVRIMSKAGLVRQVRGLATDSFEVSAEQAVALRNAFDQAGVAFTKLGQMLSTRPDIVGPIYAQELATLTVAASQEPWESIRDTIEESLGRPIDQVFSSIDPVPLAAASLSQVHRATLLDGSQVVIKVQRPGVIPQVLVDLDIMCAAGRTIERAAKSAKDFGLASLLDGFANNLRMELNFLREVDSIKTIKQVCNPLQVKVPEVIDQFCRENMIVMEYFDGTPLATAHTVIASLSDKQRQEAAHRLMEALMTQILRVGVFHSDLHSGNILIWPDGTVGMLDCGSVGRIDAVSRQNLAMLLWSIDADDPRMATDALVELLDCPDYIDISRLQRHIGIFMTRVRSGVGSVGSLTLFVDLMPILLDYGFQIPESIAQAFRALGSLEGTLLRLSPSFDVVTSGKKIGQEQFMDVSNDQIRHRLTQLGLSALPILEQLPHKVNKIASDLESGRFTMSLRHFSHREDQSFLMDLTHQIVTAILAGFMALSAVILLVTDTGPQVTSSFSAFQLTGFILGFGSAILMLRSIALIFGRRIDSDELDRSSGRRLR